MRRNRVRIDTLREVGIWSS